MMSGGDGKPAFKYCRCLMSSARAGDRDRPPQMPPNVPPSYPAQKLPQRYQNRPPWSPRQQTPNSQRTSTATHSHRTVNTRSTHGQHTVNIRSTRRSTSRGLSEKRQAGVKMVVWGGDGKPAF